MTECNCFYNNMTAKVYMLPMLGDEDSHIQPKVAAPVFYLTHEQMPVNLGTDLPDFQIYLQQNVHKTPSVHYNHLAHWLVWATISQYKTIIQYI